MSGGRALTVLFAPDSFKGSLTSVEVATALASGARSDAQKRAIIGQCIV